MSATLKVAVFVGSLRKGSYNRMVAKALVTLAPAGPQPEIVEIGHLPFYNQDQDDEGAPPAWVAFRETVKAADAVRS
jgi:chromate reductase, NAD(P)H dehydrogenase (quinone)